MVPPALGLFWSDGTGLILGLGAVLILGKTVESYFASRGHYEVADGISDVLSIALTFVGYGGIMWLLVKVIGGGLFWI